MYDANSLLAESREALGKVWFLQSLEVSDRTDSTLSLRLYIRHDLFVQVFLGELTGSLYFALIEGNQRIFGIDRESKQWHMHPFEDPYNHQPFVEGLGPRPLLAFLSRVEMLLIEKDLF